MSSVLVNYNHLEITDEKGRDLFIFKSSDFHVFLAKEEVIVNTDDLYELRDFLNTEFFNPNQLDLF